MTIYLLIRPTSNKPFHFHMGSLAYTEKKIGVIRNLKRVSRFATISKPFLGFVRRRFRITLCSILLKKRFRSEGFVKHFFYFHQKRIS